MIKIYMHIHCRSINNFGVGYVSSGLVVLCKIII